jgi:hypothetical protein
MQTVNRNGTAVIVDGPFGVIGLIIQNNKIYCVNGTSKTIL